ncbi:hypothetical protein [Spirosoma spitsbergense]|nr:hypothetical protein [Spirosoma spitsbergense]
MTDVKTGKFHPLTPRASDEESPVNGVIWSNKGDCIVYDRYVTSREGRFI